MKKFNDFGIAFAMSMVQRQLHPAENVRLYEGVVVRLDSIERGVIDRIGQRFYDKNTARWITIRSQEEWEHLSEGSFERNETLVSFSTVDSTTPIRGINLPLQDIVSPGRNCVAVANNADFNFCNIVTRASANPNLLQSSLPIKSNPISFIKDWMTMREKVLKLGQNSSEFWEWLIEFSESHDFLKIIDRGPEGRGWISTFGDHRSEKKGVAIWIPVRSSKHHKASSKTLAQVKAATEAIILTDLETRTPEQEDHLAELIASLGGAEFFESLVAPKKD